MAPLPPPSPIEPANAVVKVTLRQALDAELLLLGAYGAFVARPLRGTPLSAPLADWARDRDALIVSSDRLATLNAHLPGLIRMLKTANSEGASRHRAAAEPLMADVRQQLDLASRVVCRNGGER